MSEKTIKIICPHCGKLHKYYLRVHISLFLFGTPSAIRRFKRLFTCPKTNEDFEAILEIKEDKRAVILDVEVLGPVGINKKLNEETNGK